MKLHNYGVAIAIGAGGVAADIFPAQRGSPALDSRDLSLKGRNILSRQSLEFCDTSGLYYCETAGGCCGVTVFSCLPAGADCCSSMSEYGIDLWCPSGSHCMIEDSYVQCQDESGSFVSADSSAYAEPTSTIGDSSPTPSPTDPADSNEDPGSSSSGGGSKKSGGKKKGISGAVIGGAVAGPLIGAIVIGAVVFFLCVRKKKRTQANANAAMIASHNGGGQPAMSSGPSPAPMGGGTGGYFNQSQDMKTPAYTQQYEIPTPIASPPPQWTPANQDQGNITPAPLSPPQQVVQPYNGGVTTPTPVSPMNTGNPAPSIQPMYQPQPVHGNAVELPPQSNTQPLPRSGAHEMQ